MYRIFSCISVFLGNYGNTTMQNKLRTEIQQGIMAYTGYNIADDERAEALDDVDENLGNKQKHTLKFITHNTKHIFKSTEKKE